MLDGQVILPNGFHNGGHYSKGKKSISFKAPEQPGVYMLWQIFALEYSMEDAINNRKDHDCTVGEGRAVNNFIAWVEVVTEEGMKLHNKNRAIEQKQLAKK
jgi:hypothetical protein